MALIDANGPGAADPPGEEDPRADQPLHGGMDRAEGLAHRLRELPEGELPHVVRAKETEDTHLGLGAQEILEHRMAKAAELYRFFDYIIDFSI